MIKKDNKKVAQRRRRWLRANIENKGGITIGND